MKVLITGWAGFIGSNLVRHCLDQTDWEMVGMDSMTYAARPLWALQKAQQTPKTSKGARFTPEGSWNDIRRMEDCLNIVRIVKPDVVIHLAAESHVCHSLEAPTKFVHTNVTGTANLLEAVRQHAPKAVFHFVSTDEVFGVAEPGTKFHEGTQYDPRSPYAASKAAADHLVRAYHHSYGLNTRISNCSNNFGPNQHEEKLIPKTIAKILKGERVTLYGPGTQVRDWIWVEDHARGIIDSITRGSPGETYLFGGDKELSNRKVASECLRAVIEVAREQGIRVKDYSEVTTDDRPTDDARYAIDCSKAKRKLGWFNSPDLFFDRLKETVRWQLKYSNQ